MYRFLARYGSVYLSILCDSTKIAAWSGRVPSIAVHREGRFSLLQQHGRRPDIFAPRGRSGPNVPASASERPHAGRHGAHELVEPSAHERAETLSSRHV